MCLLMGHPWGVIVRMYLSCHVSHPHSTVIVHTFVFASRVWGSSLQLNPNNGNTSDIHIQIVESVQNDLTPKDSYKRKRTPSPLKRSNEGGLPEEIDNKKVIYIYIYIYIYISTDYLYMKQFY
jgi:hypothetical protein